MSFMQYFDEYKKYLSDLVAFNTASSDNKAKDNSNAQLIDYLEDFFKDRNFYCHKFKVDEGKYNLYITSAKTDGGLMLCGHTDTVVAKEELWESSPFTLVHKDDYLTGLGATDMKGYVALIMLFASHGFSLKADKPFSALFTCDEESSMAGAIDYKQKYSYKPDLILIGEATSNQAVIAHKGYMAFKMQVTGRGCHSSNPSLGINAIECSMAFLNEIAKLKDSLKDITDSRFEVASPTLNLGVISGGNGVNTVCPTVEIDFELRPMSIYNTQQAYESLSAITDKLNTQYGNIFKLQRLYDDIEPFDCTDKKTLDILKQATGSDLMCVNYCTEASFLGTIAPCAVLGPGTIKHAHSVNEKIAIAQLDEAYTQLLTIYKQICM